MNEKQKSVALLSAVTIIVACSPDQGRALAPRPQQLDEEDDGDQMRFGPWSTPMNLGDTVNSTSNDNHPAISRDGLSLYITSDRPGGVNGVNAKAFSEIWVAQRERLDAAWGAPRNLGSVINVAGFNVGVPNLTPDGHRIFFNSTQPGGCGAADLWVSHRKNKHDDFGWETPVNLGCTVNSAAAETAPTYFEDEETGIVTLYFTSTRPGIGGNDIYASTLGDDGAFGPPAIVAELSTRFDETRTAIRRDGLEFFFASNRPGGLAPSGIGANDIWVSTRTKTTDPWSAPQNLGRPVNSEFEDGAPALSWEGTTLYFYSRRHPEDPKRTDRDLFVTTRSRLRENGLVSHVIAPQATDPAIDRALDDHLTWLDTSARTNHQLFVFMPGTGVPPAKYQLVQQEAAHLGFHVVGLMFPNSVRLATACPLTADPAACFENARLEILDGIDQTPVVDVNPSNSIDNRLTKLLQYLTVHFPEEGWARFLSRDGPRWSRIAVGGHSQGGGEAAMIARLRVVPRVVLFSSVPDAVHTTQAAPWVATHVTPPDRYWALAHDQDPSFLPIRASWDLLGMGAFGGPVFPEKSAPPYAFTHMLVTDLPPDRGLAPHGSTVGDDATPRGADGRLLLLDAWRYMLTATTVDQDGSDSGQD